MVFVAQPRPENYERDFILARVSVEDRGHSSPCWIWQSGINSRGYPTSKPAGCKCNKLMHRFSHEAFIGPISQGLVVDHLCRVTCCVNPAHLEAVTQSKNVLRGLAAARRTRGEEVASSDGHDRTVGDIARHRGRSL